MKDPFQENITSHTLEISILEGHKVILLHKFCKEEKENQNDQVRPHFQENLVDENYLEQPKYHMHPLGENESNAFVTVITQDFSGLWQS